MVVSQGHDRQRQAQGELQKQVVEHGFHRIQQRTGFHQVVRVAGGFESQRGDEQGAAGALNELQPVLKD